jgi:hypothetical protein
MKCYKDNKIFAIDSIFAENFAQKVAFLEQRGEKYSVKNSKTHPPAHIVFSQSSWQSYIVNAYQNVYNGCE